MRALHQLATFPSWTKHKSSIGLGPKGVILVMKSPQTFNLLDGLIAFLVLYMITTIIVKSQLNLSNTQMSKGNSQLKYFTLILQIIFLQTCHARKSKHYCPPSACGDIRNISYPFHLNTDPKHCRFSGIEFACEGNQTVIWLSSKKYMIGVSEKG